MYFDRLFKLLVHNQNSEIPRTVTIKKRTNLYTTNFSGSGPRLPAFYLELFVVQLEQVSFEQSYCSLC